MTSIALADEGKIESGRPDHKGHQMMTTQDSPAPSDVKLVDAGNETCPISGDPVNGTDYVAYNGKRYGLCCKGCDAQLLKDPEKYIKALKDKGDLK